jgi:hypothetical protein
MTTGALLFPVGYTPMDGGAAVPSGRLYFYRTGTSTDQDTYSDSTLSTPNANPVVLNSEGYLTTKVYGNPASGYDYRVTFTDSAASQIWQVDDVVVDGADTATFTEGTFTGTLTGYAAGPTGTVAYRIVNNSSGTGKLCQLYVTAAITGTSNATSFTMTGLPAAVQPVAAVEAMCILTDNGVPVYAQASIAAAGSTITFATDAAPSSTGWTNTGTKAVPAGWQLTYAI